MSEEQRDDFRELVAWQRAMVFVELVYAFTDTWTADEPSGITVQVRSLAVSIPAAVAKGHGMFSGHEFAHQLRIAHDALSEVETLLKFGSRSNPSGESELESMLKSASGLRRQLNQLLNSLDLTVPN